MSLRKHRPKLEPPAVDPSLWPLDPSVVFLNHGSFGSCPRSILEYQTKLRARLERQPVQFMVRELEGLLDEARAALAAFVGAHPNDLAFIPNATTGVNTVLRSLQFQPRDELLVTDHEYNACRNALDFIAARTAARVKVAKIPFPLDDPAAVTTAILDQVTPQTRLLLIDHVTSQTGLILPVADIVQRLNALRIDTLVDGAHAPGMIPLGLDNLGAAYYTGNCHKWLCAPKGAAFLHVRRDRQAQIHPLSISHGANSSRQDRSRFQLEFAWTGTSDPTPFLCVPPSIKFMADALPGGWKEVMQRNHNLALAARATLLNSLSLSQPAPKEMIGALASIPIPDSDNCDPPRSALYMDPWQDLLMNAHRIEVPIIPWPQPPRRILRISAQLYNSLPQYELLADALRAVCSADPAC